MADDPTGADALDSLLKSGFVPESLDQVHDTLRLVGAVLANLALLKVVIDPTAENRDIVAAAKTLANLKEAPADIAERLRKSALSSLSTKQLQAIIQAVEQADAPSVDLGAIIHSVKDGDT